MLAQARVAGGTADAADRRRLRAAAAALDEAGFAAEAVEARLLLARILTARGRVTPPCGSWTRCAPAWAAAW
ncbi:MAG: hypothetical protein U0Y82_16310 [Thermoleophilia bacterium]